MSNAIVDLNQDEQSCAAWIAKFLKTRGIDRIIEKTVCFCALDLHDLHGVKRIRPGF